MTADAPVSRDDGAPNTTAAEAPREGDRLRDALMTVEPGRRRRAIMTRHLVATVADLMGRDSADIDPTAPLASLGLTSAQIVELRTRLDSSLGVALSATVGWQYPTLDRLGRLVAERMGVPLDLATGSTPAPAAAAAPAADLRDGPNDLDDEQVAALLLATIEQMDDVIPR